MSWQIGLRTTALLFISEALIAALVNRCALVLHFFCLACPTLWRRLLSAMVPKWSPAVKYRILTHFCLCSCRKPTRAEQEAALQKLREEWESQQAKERENLERKQQLALEKMKLETKEAQQKEMTELEQEKDQFLRELRERLDRDKKKVRS